MLSKNYMFNLLYKLTGIIILFLVSNREDKSSRHNVLCYFISGFFLIFNIRCKKKAIVNVFYICNVPFLLNSKFKINKKISILVFLINFSFEFSCYPQGEHYRKKRYYGSREKNQIIRQSRRKRSNNTYDWRLKTLQVYSRYGRPN